jgi:hypothetical protein
MPRRSALAVAAVACTLVASCRRPAAAPPAPADAPQVTRVPFVRADTVASFTVQFGDGALNPTQMRELAPQVHALLVEPDSIWLAVGEVYWHTEMLHVRVQLKDGSVPGTLKIFDFGMTPGAAAVTRDGGRSGVEGRSAGVSHLRVNYPRFAWPADAGQPAQVLIPIIVRE